MNESYKFFSLEDKQWNLSFLNATKNKDKKKVFELLSKAQNVYLDEYYIDHSIEELNTSSSSTEKKEQIISGLKKCKIVTDVVYNENTISIKTAKAPIQVSKITDIIPMECSKDNIVSKSSYRSEYISQLLSFPNSIVTGYTYGIADKAKSIETWVEFKNNKNQEFVVFPSSNTIYNKEGFYFLKHAEPIKKVSSDDLKGKTSVGKSSGAYSELSNCAELIDIEIDMDDER